GLTRSASKNESAAKGSARKRWLRESRLTTPLLAGTASDKRPPKIANNAPLSLVGVLMFNSASGGSTRVFGSTLGKLFRLMLPETMYLRKLNDVPPMT